MLLKQELEQVAENEVGVRMVRIDIRGFLSYTPGLEMFK
jgi:hypothetical protein